MLYPIHARALRAAAAVYVRVCSCGPISRLYLRCRRSRRKEGGRRGRRRHGGCGWHGDRQMVRGGSGMAVPFSWKLVNERVGIVIQVSLSRGRIAIHDPPDSYAHPCSPPVQSTAHSSSRVSEFTHGDDFCSESTDTSRFPSRSFHTSRVVRTESQHSRAGGAGARRRSPRGRRGLVRLPLMRGMEEMRG